LPEHISRKELKKDEFRETLAHGAEAVLSHQQLASYVIVAIAVVVVAVFGWRFYSERETVKAAAAYDDAMKVFKARIRTAGEPAGDPNDITYVDDKNKYDDADKKFETVAKKYPHTRPGQISAYYAALCLEHLNRDAEAQKWLDRVISSGDPDFVSLARLELAQLDDRNNKSAEAEKIYQDLVAHPSVFVSKPVALMAFADHYRQAMKLQEAAKLYNEVKTEFPDSTLAQQAGQQLDLISPKS
jgi:predicted negative regulator of RcsB-dependent stress response